MTADRLHDHVPVWDRFVRVAHWALVLAFAVAYLTEDDALTVHVWAGYAVGAIIVLRIVWGFVGPQHARFSDFLYRPGVIIGYLGALVRLRGRRYLGHSPAGGAMVILLLAGLLGTVGSGVWLYAVEDNRGPLAGIVSTAAPPTTSAGGYRDGGDEEHDDRDDHDGGRQSHDSDTLEEIHEVLANLTLILVFLHIGGVLLASFVHRENLPRAMITGTKRR
ncbi:MAG: cytochrome b/b6 domain-containing protein [Alphaproteobacteria bacterium]